MFKIWICFFALFGLTWAQNSANNGTVSPNYIPINLDQTNPTFVLWLADMKVNDAYVVCSKINNDLDLFVTQAVQMANLQPFLLYDSKTVDNGTFITDLSNQNQFTPGSTNGHTPSSISSKSGCFTIWSNAVNATWATAFFRIASIQSKNCVGDNIFEAPTIPSTSINAGANANGSCEMIFLSSRFEWPGFRIGKISGTGSNESFIFKSAINQNVFLNLNYKDFNDWNNFGLYTPALSLVVPKSGNISIETQILQDFFTIQKQGCSYYRNGVMASPSYAGFKHKSAKITVFYKSSLQRSNLMTFNVKKLYGNETVIFNNGPYINHTFVNGETFNVTNTTFNVMSYENDPANDGFLIEYTLSNIWTPNYISILLNDNNPFYVTVTDNIKINDAMVFCSASKDVNDIELFITDANFDPFYIYDSAATPSFETCIQNPFQSKSITPPSIVSSKGCLIFYRWSHIISNATIFVRSKTSQIKNCGSSNNVFQMFDNSMTATPVSAGDNACEIILLATSYKMLTSISIDKLDGIQSGNLAIKSAINNQLLANIPSDDIKYWMNFGFYTYALSVVVPKGSTLTITGSVQRTAYNIKKYGCQHIQKGVIASPSLSGLNYSLTASQILYQSTFAQQNKMDFKVSFLSDSYSVQLNSNHTFTQSENFTATTDKSMNIQVQTSLPSKSDGFLIYYTFTSVINPVYNNVTLSDSRSYLAAFIDEIPVNTGTVVCSTANDVDFYITDGGSYDSFCLYDSTELENNILLGDSYPLTSKSGCFHLYHATNTLTSATVFIRSRTYQSKNCGSSNNVFFANSSGISISSTSGGACEIALITPKYSDLTSISIEKMDGIKSGNVTLKSAFNGKQLANIPASELPQWINFGIHTYALTVTIPANSDFTMSTSVQTDAYDIVKQPCQYIQKGIIVSPSYSGLNSTISNAEVLYQSALFRNETLTFAQIDVYGNEMIRVYYDTYNYQTINSTQNLTITAQSFLIRVFFANPSTDGFLIEYTFTSPFNPTFKYVNISDSNPYYLGQMSNFALNDAVVICSQYNDAELFITDGNYDSFYLYDSNTLDNCSPMPSKFSSTPLKANSGCFVLYQWNNAGETGTVFVRSPKSHTTSCTNRNNVYQVGSAATNSATSNGSCEMILISPSYPIEINGVKSNNGDRVVTLISTLNNKAIVDLPISELSLWHDFSIYAYALTVSIPSNISSVTVNTKAANNPYSITKKGCPLVQKGIMTSPSYAGLTEFDGSELYSSGLDRNNVIEFTVLQLGINETVVLTYDSGDHTFVANEKFVVNSTGSFSISTMEGDSETSGFIIQYTLTSDINPNYITKTFTDKEPYVLFTADNINVNDALIFCSPSNDIEIYVTTTNIGNSFWLHNSKNLDNCNDVPSSFGPNKITSQNGCFNLYRYNTANTNAVMLIRSQSLHTKNCIFNNSTQTNIFDMAHANNSMVGANEKGPCDMIYLSQPSLFKPDTTLSIDKIDGLQSGSITLSNPILNTTFVTIPAADSTKWKGFGIPTKFLSFSIPSKNNITFSTSINQGTYHINKTIDGQKGLMISPGYMNEAAPSGLNLYYDITSILNVTVTLFVNEIYDNETLLFQSQNMGKWVNTNLTEVNQTTSQSATYFALHGNEEPGQGFFITYSMDDYFHPQTFRVDLNATSSSYALWLDNMNVYDAITVCTTDGSIKIQVTSSSYSDGLKNYRLFDSTTIDNFVTDLKTISDKSSGYTLGSITSKNGCLTVFREDGNLTHATAFFSVPSVQKQNCVRENVFQAQNPSSNDMSLFSVRAGNEGSCEMIILASQNSLPLISIENLTATSDTYFVIKNVFNQKTLFNLSGNDASSFKKVGIYSSALSIIIPAGKTINLLAYNSEGPYTITSDISMENGIMVSPSFNGIYGSLKNNLLYKIHSNDMLSLSVNVKSLDGTLVMQNGNDNTTFQTGQTTTKQGTNFNFFFDNTNNPNNGFLVEYSINKTITTSTDNGSFKTSINVCYFVALISISFHFFNGI